MDDGDGDGAGEKFAVGIFKFIVHGFCSVIDFLLDIDAFSDQASEGDTDEDEGHIFAFYSALDPHNGYGNGHHYKNRIHDFCGDKFIEEDTDGSSNKNRDCI